MKESLWNRLKRYFVETPIEPILNPMPGRLMTLGATAAILHAVFYAAWAHLEPTLYESAPLRLAAICSSLLFMVPAIYKNPESSLTKALFVVVIFLQIPVFFFFMYLMNAGHRTWLASTAMIMVVLYGLTDWRVATAQIFIGFTVAVNAWLLVKPSAQISPVIATDIMVFLFALISGLTLALFSDSTRQLRLKHFNEVMGILAHELRTPLSANGLLADTILAQSEKVAQPDVRKNLQLLAGRVQALTDAMNHHIDLQIINAKMLQMPKFQDRICASELVSTTVLQYPFRSRIHRQCVKVTIEEDFSFRGSLMYFGKVLDNLIGNAIKSLQASGSDFHDGVITLTVSREKGHGIIAVADRGMGIEPKHIANLFKAHYSSDRQASHGLGLYFCRRVVLNAGGTICVRSMPLLGARFVIRLPALAEPDPARRSFFRPLTKSSRKSSHESTRPFQVEILK